MCPSITPSHSFSEEVRFLLTEAGWHPGRTSGLKSPAGQSAARTWPAAVLAFVQEFGGLQLNFVRRDASLGLLHFDAESAQRHALPALLDLCQQRLGTDVHVVGEAYLEGLLLLMDEQGQVFGAYEEQLYHVGATGAAAIEVLCHDMPFQELS